MINLFLSTGNCSLRRTAWSAQWQFCKPTISIFNGSQNSQPNGRLHQEDCWKMRQGISCILSTVCCTGFCISRRL